MKTIPFRVCFGALALVLSLCLATLARAERSARETPRATRSAAANSDAAAVERGRYLVRITGCNDCHTPGYKEQAGKIDEAAWLVGDSSFGWQGPWGTTYAANLRLYMQRLSLEDWLQAARRPLRPPMPWFSLRDMTDADLAAIYHYVRSLGPAGSPARAYAPPGKPVQTPVVKLPAS